MVTFNSYIIFPAQVSIILLFTLNGITLQYVTSFIEESLFKSCKFIFDKCGNFFFLFYFTVLFDLK